jgi:hypothetical protein
MHEQNEEKCEKYLNEKLYNLLSAAVIPTAKRIENYFKNLPQIAKEGKIHEEIFQCNYSGKKYKILEENI